MKIRFVVTVALVFSCLTAQAQGVRWAGKVDIDVPNFLHAPDDRGAGAGPGPTLSDFSPTFRHPRLASLLRVPDAVLARADVIAFEGNGPSRAGLEGGWESSIWTFTDGTNTYVAKFNELVGKSSDPSVIGNGNIDGNAYRSFFGICSPNPQNLAVGYILFDLDGVRPRVNVTSPNFQIRIQNRGGPGFGEGQPDPDAVGVLTKCP